jgi:hypothetical protein
LYLTNHNGSGRSLQKADSFKFANQIASMHFTHFWRPFPCKADWASNTRAKRKPKTARRKELTALGI